MRRDGAGEAHGPVVLVGVDGSTTSGRALDWAVREAARRGATLRVLHVAYVPVVSTPFVGGVYYPTVDEVDAIARPVLDAAVDRAARVDPTVHVRTTLRSGAPT
jgi:nucleotide-binding universal stress UspA family protein